MGAVIDLHAGGGAVGRIVAPTPRLEVMLKHPSGVEVTADGSVLIADSNANAIRRVGPDAMVVTIAGGNGVGYGGDGGPAVDAMLCKPTMAVEAPDGSIFITDRDNDAIRVIRTDGTIHTYAGGRGNGYDGDGGSAIGAQISRPRALALDGRGGLWFTDRDNHAVRVIDPDGTIRTVAGGRGGYGGDGGDARDALLWRPRGLGFDARGHLFIADRNNHAVREVDLEGRISTFAGGNGLGYSGDGGHCRDAQFNYVSGIVFDTEGVAYVSDHLNDAIRRVDPDGRIDTVVGGNGAGHTGDGGPARAACLSYPSGLTIATDGTLYIADRNNDLTRLVTGLCAGRLPLPSAVPELAPRVAPETAAARSRSLPARIRRRLVRR